MNQAEATNLTGKTISNEELRLLSLNIVSKILAKRYEHLVKLVRTGRIKSIPIGR